MLPPLRNRRFQRVLTGFSGILDKYPGAAAAYSLERLAADTSNVVRVRRSSDDTEQDFTATEVDNGELVNFANNGTSSLYNQRMYFDGVDDSVDVGKPTGTGDTTTLDVEAKIITTVVGSFKPNVSRYGGSNDIGWLIGKNNNDKAYAQFSTDGTTETRITLNGTTNINDGEQHTIRLILNGTTAKLYVDGVEEDTAGFSGTIHNTTANMRIGETAANFFNGIAFDVILRSYSGDIINQWNGHGNTNADWEDQIGLNDGTVNGSPALYTGQGFDWFAVNVTDQSGATLRTAAQATAASQPQMGSDGALVTDGNGNPSTTWDGVDDDLDVAAGFAGLTSANVYAVTDNAGTVSLDTLTAQDISAATNLSTILTSLTYGKVTAVVIYPDATNQAAIKAKLADIYGITLA